MIVLQIIFHKRVVSNSIITPICNITDPDRFVHISENITYLTHVGKCVLSLDSIPKNIYRFDDRSDESDSMEQVYSHLKSLKPTIRITTLASEYVLESNTFDSKVLVLPSYSMYVILVMNVP